jgi:hypothetical protein
VSQGRIVEKRITGQTVAAITVIGPLTIDIGEPGAVRVVGSTALAIDATGRGTVKIVPPVPGGGDQTQATAPRSVAIGRGFGAAGATGDRSISVAGNSDGILSTGDNAVNVQLGRGGGGMLSTGDNAVNVSHQGSSVVSGADERTTLFVPSDFVGVIVHGTADVTLTRAARRAGIDIHFD